MKKTYSAPEVKVERFDVEDIITVSGVIGQLEAGSAVTSTGAVTEVFVDTKTW